MNFRLTLMKLQSDKSINTTIDNFFMYRTITVSNCTNFYFNTDIQSNLKGNRDIKGQMA